MSNPGSSVRTHCFAADAIAQLEPRTWRDTLRQLLASGQRVVTLYGRREADDVVLTVLLLGNDGALQVLRTRTAVLIGYHELTSECPALHCFERELHEQTGLRVAGHAWLKPIRYQGGEQAQMNSYPFYRIEGKEVHEVAVGPIHAGVIEPGAFRFMCLGEQVHHLEIQLGYQHRGVEKLLLAGDPRRHTPLVETIAGDSSIAHAWAYSAALEALAGADLSIEVEVARVVVLELERVAMHLASLAGLASDIGFLQGATTYGRLRTTAINTTMQLCGSRFGRTALRPGGVRIRTTAELGAQVHRNLAQMRHDLALVNALFGSARSVQHRLRNVGTLSSARARALGVVGLVARASGVAIDGRQSAGGAFAAAPMPLCVLPDGDCWARARLRILEMDASLAWLAANLDRCARPAPDPLPLEALAPHRLAVAIVEGWRGEVVYCLETGDRGQLVHAKVQDPSLRNWMGLAIAVRGNEISDFPICNKSFDLSYCGNDL